MTQSVPKTLRLRLHWKDLRAVRLIELDHFFGGHAEPQSDRENAAGRCSRNQIKMINDVFDRVCERQELAA